MAAANASRPVLIGALCGHLTHLSIKRALVHLARGKCSLAECFQVLALTRVHALRGQCKLGNLQNSTRQTSSQSDQMKCAG